MKEIYNYSGGIPRLINLIADRSLLGDAILEATRWYPPDPVFPRTVTRDTVLDGVELPAGAVLHLCISSANRDPSPVWLYFNAWIAWGAHRVGRFDISVPAASFLALHQSGDGSFTNPNDPQTLGVFGPHFLNPASVIDPAVNTFGTCAAGAFRGPGLATSDMSIVKAFSISERTNFQFITQFINLTNTPILGAPSSSGGTNVKTFGVITSSNPGRQVQFGMKLIF